MSPEKAPRPVRDRGGGGDKNAKTGGAPGDEPAVGAGICLRRNAYPVDAQDIPAVQEGI